jgi:glucose/arabinose dehydrogenase
MQARFDGTRLVDAKDVFVADAWIPADVNLGSRLVFDRDGLLHMTPGERNDPNAAPNQGLSAQDLNAHTGKIVTFLHQHLATPTARNPSITP